MIRKIILQPFKKSSHALTFSGSYYDKHSNQNVHLLANWKLAMNRDITKDEKLYQFVFDGKMNRLEIAYDDTVHEQVMWIDKLKRHNLCKCDGNTNCLATPYYEIIDIYKDIAKNVRRNKYMQVVANMVSNMKINDMKNIAYLFGHDASSLTAEQIYLKLCSVVPGTELGILMHDPEDAIRMFQNPDRDIIVNVQKALSMGIIENRNGLYYAGQEQVGRNVNDMVAYFKDNKKIYEGFIEREVRDRDVLPLGSEDDIDVSELLGDVKEKSVVPKEALKSKEVSQAERDARVREEHDLEMMRQDELRPLREQAKALGVKGWQIVTISKETLKQKIEDAVIEKKKAEMAGQE